MKQSTTETHSGHKRHKSLIHYAIGLVILLTASSGIYPEPPKANAAVPGGSTSTSIDVAVEAKLADPLNILVPKQGFSLREYSLSKQVSALESDLAAANDRVDAKIAQIDAKFANYAKVDDVITKLYSYVGKAPYVFSGIGPSGWDCSGLTAWFYHEYQGIWIEHSATAQMNGGTKVSDPVPGDIVAFYYPGSKNSFHVAIYVGGGMMIHARNPKDDTVLESVSRFAKGENSKVAYIRY